MSIAPLSPGTVLPDIRRIAVLRANALGDYLFAVPALQALRSTYPHSEIVLLGNDWHADFLTSRPGPVDRVVVVPPTTGVREPRAGEVEDPAEQADFFAAMRAEGFDLALQMHGGGRYSNVFVSRLGARWSVGLRTPDAAPLDLCLHYSYYQPEIPRLLELVGLVGAAPESLEPLIAVTDQDRAEAEQVLADLHQPVVALHPGATDPRRRWPPEHFAAVGDALAADGASIVLTGSGTEQAVVAEVADRMLAPARPLVDAVTLGGLAGTYARCALVVSNDTGPRHLAQAVGTATVAVYWCGNLINAGPLTRQRHRPHVSWTVHCPVCGADTTQPPPPGAQNRCEHDPSFVSSVSVHAVRADALDLLAAEAGRRRPVG